MDKKKKIIIAGAAVAAVVIVAAVAFRLKSGSGMAGGGAMGGGPGGMGGQGGMQQEVNYTIVKADVPYTGSVSVSSSLTATVEAADVVHVYAKAAGDVTAVNVSAGDYVNAGDIICEIDTSQVESAKNSLDSAELSLSNAQSTLNRMKILYSGGDITDQEYSNYESQLKSAQLQYDSAKLNYDRQVEYSSVTAPISGRIESCSIEVYDRASTNTELCVISGEGAEHLVFYVSERMLKNLKTGDELRVVKNGTEYKGQITEISTIVDSSTGLFKIKASLEETDEIAIGSSVKVIFVTDRAENAMLVPVDAIYYSNGKGYVYVVEDNTAVMRSVEVGLYDSEAAEIKSGLEDSDLVVSTWSSNLYEGAIVRLAGDETADAVAAGAGPEAGVPGDMSAAPGTAGEAGASMQGAAGATDGAPSGAGMPDGAGNGAEHGAGEHGQGHQGGQQ